jgi:glyoxylase-like metal-dependent hydrolase (beta-lactamase superfamily II)/rhodanese-related sulfurtransferase
MFMQQFFVDGLGCASYLIGCEAAGVAAVIDPQRDVRPYLAAAAHGITITHIIETHLHADHVSGNTELAQRTGAPIYLHPAAAAEFPHKPLADGAEIVLGGVSLYVRHAPGHTPDSLILLAADTNRAAEPWLAFTGDLLFVGDVGRPDLVGPEAARSLAADLYTSLFDGILRQDDALLIYPGHGAGSLCGRAIGSMRVSSLGYERRHNPALAPRPLAEFVDYMTANLPEQPANHRQIKTANRRGPTVLGDLQVRPLDLDHAIPHFQRGAALLDLRPKADFIAQHVPGSVYLAADDQLANRVGFILPPDQPVILLLAPDADAQALGYSLARVGYERVLGYLAGGIAEWAAAGLPVTAGDIQDVSPAELSELLIANHLVVIDVREPWEYAQGHIPAARLIPLGQLATSLADLDPAQPVATVCASGSRSQSAAALLGQQGFATIYNLQGGMDAWTRAGGQISRERPPQHA